jgi:MoaA/NifB/PqqE/SkfB family radical SAM enzyme
MKRLSLTAQRKVLTWTLLNTRRRIGWFLDNLTPSRASNLALAVAEYVGRREVMRAWPVVLKVDISPLCNLGCTVCVHARPSSTSSAELKTQTFRARQKMPLDAFERVVDEVAGKTCALSLYYLGDPLMHPDLAAMCRYAWRKKLNTHISTNLSFELDDARIDELVQCGLTHLTVCVDGLTQELYERTRVGGDIALVLKNLERIIARRDELGRTYPRVEVQFIKYQHNQHERLAAIERFAALGVDQFTDFWGGLFNYTDLIAGKSYRVFGPKTPRGVPTCMWPHFAMVIKFDGDVIPCCNYRHGEQYTADPADARPAGNALRDGVRAVWNSPAYQAMRRLVSDPRRVRDEPELEQSFCSGCPASFHTDADQVKLRGDTHRWEDVFQRDARGHVHRRAEAEPKLITLGRKKHARA